MNSLNIFRDITTSTNGSIFLASEYEKKVSVWDIESLEKLSELDTVMDAGGYRLAITNDGKYCIAAAYQRHGVAKYNIADGSIVWRRKDIKQTQNVTLNPQNDKIYLGTEASSMVVLDNKTGATIEKIKAAKRIFFDANSSNYLTMNGWNSSVLVGRDVKLPSPTFSFADAIFNGTQILLSPTRSDLVLYNSVEKNELWRIPVEKDISHFTKLAFSKKNNMYYAVMFIYDMPRNPDAILYGISPEGEIKFKFPLHDKAASWGAFCQDSTKFICGNGEVYRLSANEPELIHKFNWR